MINYIELFSTLLDKITTKNPILALCVGVAIIFSPPGNRKLIGSICIALFVSCVLNFYWSKYTAKKALVAKKEEEEEIAKKALAAKKAEEEELDEKALYQYNDLTDGEKTYIDDVIAQKDIVHKFALQHFVTEPWRNDPHNVLLLYQSLGAKGFATYVKYTREVYEGSRLMRYEEYTFTFDTDTFKRIKAIKGREIKKQL